MAIEDTGLSVQDLKRVKNRVIGNPKAKEALVQDDAFMSRLVDCLDPSSSPSTSSSDLPSSLVELRTEAAHIVGSLCHGSQLALSTLLRLHTAEILVASIAQFDLTSDPLALKSTYARALRSLVASVADVVGPSEYGLRPEYNSELRGRAREVLDLLFTLETLDTILPLLLPPIPTAGSSTSASSSLSAASSTSTTATTHLTLLTTPITHLLASATRTPAHRAALTAWLPSAERAALEAERTRSKKRGWEKVSVSPIATTGGGFGLSSPVSPGGGSGGVTTDAGMPTATGAGPAMSGGGAAGGPWIVRAIVGILAGAKDVKLQEACLLCLAALVKDNPGVAAWVGRGWSVDVYGPPLALIHNLTKSRNVDVQLAACLCASHTLRALHSPPSTTSTSSTISAHSTASNPFDYAQSAYAQTPLDDACVRSVVSVANRIVPGGGVTGGEKEERRVRACFILYHLITDDRALCQFAFERGCLDALADAFKGITPPTSGSTTASSGGDKGGQRGEKVDRGARGEKAEPEEGWDEGEGEGVARVREATLTAIATLGLFNNKIRQAITDTHGLLPYIMTALRQGVPASCFSVSSIPASTSARARGTSGRAGTSTSNVNTPIPTRASTPTPGSTSRRPAFPSSSSSSFVSSATSTSTSASITTPERSRVVESPVKSSAGVRYAACQCVRVLSRGVSVLRTNIVDSGLGMEVFGIVMRGWSGRERRATSSSLALTSAVLSPRFGLGRGGEGIGMRDEGNAVDGLEAMGREVGERVEEVEVEVEVEDRRVLNAALAAVCNIVMEFSPLKPTFLQQGLIPRLVHLLSSSDPSLRMNALWAIKNALFRTSAESTRDMMSCLGWGRVFELLHDPDLSIQEQAYGILRNISSDEVGMEMVFREMGQDALLDRIAETVSVDTMPSTPTSPSASPSRATSPHHSISRTSSGQPPTLNPSLHERTPTMVQALYLLANLCNGRTSSSSSDASTALASAILAKPTLLANLRACLAECGSDVRKPAVDCLLKLAREHPKKRRALVESGVIGTLRRLCEWTPPTAAASSSIAGAGGVGGTASPGPGGVPVYGGVAYPHAYQTSPADTRYAYTPPVPMQMWSPSGVAIGTAAGVTSTRPSAAPMARRASGSAASPGRSLSFGPGAGAASGSAYNAHGVVGAGIGHSATPPAGGWQGYHLGGTIPVGGSSGSGSGVPIHPAFVGHQMYPAHAVDLARYTAYAYPYAGGPHHHPGTSGAGVAAAGGVRGVGGGAVTASMDLDREVYDMARMALDWLEHGEGYGL